MLIETRYGKFSGTQEEADLFELSEHKRKAKDQLKGVVNSEISAISARYPLREQDTWPEQCNEARAYRVDASAEAPLIDAAIAEAGITKEDMVSSILNNASSWSSEIGRAVGRRIRMETAIDNAITLDAVDAVFIDHGAD